MDGDTRVLIYRTLLRERGPPNGEATQPLPPVLLLFCFTSTFVFSDSIKRTELDGERERETENASLFCAPWNFVITQV